MEQYAKGSKYTAADHCVHIVLWVACHRQPFLIAKDNELLEIFKTLNAACVTPKRNTVAKDVQEIHELTKDAVIKVLKVTSFFIVLPSQRPAHIPA